MSRPTTYKTLWTGTRPQRKINMLSFGWPVCLFWHILLPADHSGGETPRQPLPKVSRTSEYLHTSAINGANTRRRHLYTYLGIYRLEYYPVSSTKHALHAGLIIMFAYIYIYGLIYRLSPGEIPRETPH